MKPRSISTGFTLIELLIVIAIILILIAIALPNFLEAQVRAKVTRVKTEQRSLETALFAYRVQNPRFPFGEAGPEPPYLRQPGYRNFPTIDVVHELTTPVAFIERVDFRDPFIANTIIDPAGFEISYYFFLNYETFHYARPTNTSFEGWCLCSFGPDQSDSGCAWLPIIEKESRRIAYEALYNPTNGTRSRGDIARYGGFVPAAVGTLGK